MIWGDGPLLGKADEDTKWCKPELQHKDVINHFNELAHIVTSTRSRVFYPQDPSAMPRPTSQDLAGFWDLLQLSIDDVTVKFDQLQQIKNNNWRPLDSPEKKVGWPSGPRSPLYFQPLNYSEPLCVGSVPMLIIWS